MNQSIAFPFIDMAIELVAFVGAPLYLSLILADKIALAATACARKLAALRSAWLQHRE